MDLKISEKSALAQKQFLDKASKLLANVKEEWQLEECQEQIAHEYDKLYGRKGTQPLLAVKGGKKAPRYLLDRDEVWVIYKPPLWQMGHNPMSWVPHVQDLVRATKSLAEAQQTVLLTNRASNLQEWHGLTMGLRWMPPDENDPHFDPYRRPVKDWGFVNRLDLETDGPVLAAKTFRAQRMLQVQLKEHIFSKAYMCLVHGKVENRIHSVETSFAELGGPEGSQTMVKHDNLSDPFYSKSKAGWWKRRHVRMAKTFLKPIAYYKKKDDQSEYTLVYVNIMSGITHQIRITMQSLGHPLVSDDRYLPREQAIADCQWCPRNFLCEVRQDWFDMNGPYKNPERRRYSRISVENPLPKLFQDILEKKLELLQKLDTTADVYGGCQYWALGDEQLMADHPKDTDYRKKVMRWGIRHGIHLDAMDRLLLLSREEIDRIMAEYKPPAEDEAFWVCPECMNLNHPDEKGRTASTTCSGFGFLTWTKQCPGKPKVPKNSKLPDGWRDYLADPTIHLIWILNPKLLAARRSAIQKSRPSWDKPPTEEDGDVATEEQIKSLHQVLLKDASQGGYGLDEEELRGVKGLENARLPLCLPQDCPVWRVRLPGRGTGSQWRYTLRGKERLKVAHDFTVKLKKYNEPIMVDTDVLPKKAILDEDEKPAVQMDSDGWSKNQWQNWQEWQKDSTPATVEPELNEKAERDRVKDFQTRIKPQEDWQSPKKRQLEDVTVEPQKRQKTRSWRKVASANRPGVVYYVDSDSGEVRNERPPDFKDEVTAVWEKMESKTAKGVYYYHNHDSGESRTQRPQGVTILNETLPKRSQVTGTTAPAKAIPVQREEGIPWERIESTSKPGHFYYFNPITGENEIKPPKVQEPWKLLESKSHRGQWYYYNSLTGENTEVPPRCAVSVTAPLSAAAPSPAPAPAAASPPVPQASPARAMRPSRPTVDDLPEGWEQHLSSKHGKFYYIHTATQETTWTLPSRVSVSIPKAEWERCESSKYPGKFYLKNSQTGETKWA